MCAVIMGAFAASPLRAQTNAACPDTVTVGACFRLLLGEGDVTDATTRATTGAEVASGKAGSAIRDFLPRLAGALLFPGISNDEGALALRFNQRLGAATAQVGVELNRPQLYPPILNLATPYAAAGVRERLEPRLDTQDDATATLALNLESTRFGRTFAPHRAAVSALVGVIAQAGGIDDAAGLGALNELDFSGKLDPARRDAEACSSANSAQVQLGCYLPAFADSVRDALRAEAGVLLSRRDVRRAAIADAGLDIVSMLLNNQPQLNLTAAYRHRDELAGPDALTASLRYEHGLRNLNWLHRRCATLTAECFNSVVRDARTREAIARAARLWVQTDLAFRPTYDLRLPVESILYRESSSLEVRAAGGYGQYFGRLAEGTRRARLDIDASYLHQVDDDTRNNRLIARVAYTQPVTEGLAAVFGAVWANRPEYVRDVQRNLTATLGVAYKLTALDPSQ
jgi:hypothetical protein